MIWDDPWIAVATTGTATTLPPLAPVLGENSFRCLRWTDLDPVVIKNWIDIVGTRWKADDLAERLTDAWVALLFSAEGDLIGTCVLRLPQSIWILETLVCRRGQGSLLMRAAIHWIWQRPAGPFAIGFTWELTGVQLVSAWWRGWMAAAAAVQYGWVWQNGECSFCPEGMNPTQWLERSRFVMPTLFRSAAGMAVVSDSGLGDGWGYVSAVRGELDWAVICKTGGWRRLWTRGEFAPKGSGWRWTGEFVVVGLLNYSGPLPSLEWITAEVAPLRS